MVDIKNLCDKNGNIIYPITSSDAVKINEETLTDVLSTINNHTHIATNIIEDTNHRFVSDSEKNIWNAKTKITNNYNNFNGVCVRTWNSGDLDSNRFRNELLNILKKCGANSIALTINTYQPTETSNNPFTRVPVGLDEIERYLLFLKENNIRVMFKHHVEIDTSNYIWRAQIDPTNADEWFNNYSTTLIEYAKLCEKYDVEVLSIGTEYRTLTKKYNDKWSALIDTVRQYYNGLLTYGANLNNDSYDELHWIEFWDKLDFIGIDFYIYPSNEWTLTQKQYKKLFYHTNNHKNSVLLIERIINKYNKPVIFCEYGKDTSTEMEGRNNYIKAFQSVFLTQEYNAGAFIWVYDPSKSSWFEKDNNLMTILTNTPVTHASNTKKTFITPKSDISGGYSKILSCDLTKTYAEALITVNLSVRGLTYADIQKYAKAVIRIANHDAVAPKVYCELNGTDINANFILYNINNSIVEFYVKVPQYTYVEYTFESNEIGLFDLFDYQPVAVVTGTESVLKVNGSSTTITIPEEYITETELLAKNYVTESYVNNAIDNNQNYKNYKIAIRNSGETDDTLAIQRVIDSNHPLFVDRDLVISDTIVLTHNSQIYGKGKTINSITMTDDSKFMFSLLTEKSDTAYDLTTSLYIHDITLIGKNIIQINEREETETEFDKLGHIKGGVIERVKMIGKIGAISSDSISLPTRDIVIAEGIGIQTTKVFDMAIRDSEIEKFGLALDFLGSDINIIDNCRIAYCMRFYHGKRIKTYGSQNKIKNCDLMRAKCQGNIYLDGTYYDTIEDNYFEEYSEAGIFIYGQHIIGTTIFNNRFDANGIESTPELLLSPISQVSVINNRFNTGGTNAEIKVLEDDYEYYYRMNMIQIKNNIGRVNLNVPPLYLNEPQKNLYTHYNIESIDGELANNSYPFSKESGKWDLKNANNSVIIKITPLIKASKYIIHFDTSTRNGSSNTTFLVNLFKNNYGSGTKIQQSTVNIGLDNISITEVSDLTDLIIEFVSNTVTINTIVLEADYSI